MIVYQFVHSWQNLPKQPPKQERQDIGEFHPHHSDGLCIDRTEKRAHSEASKQYVAHDTHPPGPRFSGQQRENSVHALLNPFDNDRHGLLKTKTKQ